MPRNILLTFIFLLLILTFSTPFFYHNYSTSQHEHMPLIDSYLDIAKFIIIFLLIGSELAISSEKKFYIKDFFSNIFLSVFNIFLSHRLWTLFFTFLIGWIGGVKPLFDIRKDIIPSFYLEVFVIILLTEFIFYFIHRLQHEVPFLWKFHQVHHTPTHLNMLNLYRVHPIDFIIRVVTPYSFLFILGFSELAMTTAACTTLLPAHLSHWNIDLNFKWLNYIIQTPEVHRWHHSVDNKESRANFGSSLMIFDVMCRTFYLPKDRPKPSFYGT